MGRGPYLPNVDQYALLGLDRKKSNDSLQISIKRMLRIIDEQDSIKRFKWVLPESIDAMLLERIIYYRGQIVLFRLRDKFYALPYAATKTIDCYGRYSGLSPLSFNGKAEADDKEKVFLPGLQITPVYHELNEEERSKLGEHPGVIIQDYTCQLSQRITPRQILVDDLLDVMANCIPYANTALINSTGVSAIRVGNADEESNVRAANRAMKIAAVTGNPYIPVVGTIDWQKLNDGQVAKAEEFMQAMQSWDNFRLTSKGLTNGGLFEKKAHMLQTEQDSTNTNAAMIMQDCLEQRQLSCKIAKSIWPDIDISCEIDEKAEEVNNPPVIDDDMNDRSERSEEEDAE